MAELNNYLLLIDTKKAHDDLEEVERHRDEAEKETKKIIEEVQKESQKAFRQAVSMMQSSWHALETFARIAGYSIPEITRAVVSGAFGAIKIFIPLLTAEAVTPGMQFQAALGMAQIAMTIAAAINAQREQEEQERIFNDINSAIGTINGLIGSFSF